jgi:hypothetical protein
MLEYYLVLNFAYNNNEETIFAILKRLNLIEGGNAGLNFTGLNL